MAWYVFDMSWALVSFFSFVCFFTLLTFLLVDCHYSITATQWHQKKGSSPGEFFFLFLFSLLTLFYLEPTWDHCVTSMIKRKKKRKEREKKTAWEMSTSVRPKQPEFLTKKVWMQKISQKVSCCKFLPFE